MSDRSIDSRTLMRDLKKRIDAEALIAGRVTFVRSHGKVNFLTIMDRTGSGQVVVDAELDLPPLQAIVECIGAVSAEERVPGGAEMQARKITVLSSPVMDLPFNPATLPSPVSGVEPGLETLLNHRGLSLRGSHQQAIIRIGSELLAAAAAHLRKNEFVEIKTPKLMGAESEGGAGLFEVRYFERLAYLAQSPQLYKQTLAATPLERVFEIGPVFRAEKHETGRHLNEFTGIDVEFAYPRTMADVMDIEEDLVRAIIQGVAENCKRELDLIGAELPRYPSTIPRVDLDTAKEIATGEKPSRAKPAEDLSPQDERELCLWAGREHNSDAVFVHSYPQRSRPFYTRALGRKKSTGFDLLLRGIEISSGALRNHDPEIIESNLRRQGLDPAGFESYLSVFRSGCPPHGGFGLGMERLIQSLLQLPNVRHASLFPRDRNRLDP